MSNCKKKIISLVNRDHKSDLQLKEYVCDYDNQKCFKEKIKVLAESKLKSLVRVKNSMNSYFKKHQNKKKYQIFFDSKSKLGMGANAEVYLGTDNISKKQFAIRSIRKPDDKNACNKLMENITKQIDIMKQLSSSEYTVNCFDFFIDSGKINIILELVKFKDTSSISMNLQEYMVYSNVKDRPVKKIFTELIKGIESIHSYGIIHRDIKPANIMLYYKANNKLSIKIIDFEFSEETLQAGQCKGPVMGTLEYMAPEILTGQKYGTSVDIWASGVILYEMLLNSIPFYNDFIEASLINRAVKNAVLNVTIPFHYTKKEKRIIVYNIKRAKVNSRVFSLFKTENKEAYNLLMGKTCEKYKFIFNPAPSKRITATEMKCHEYIKDLCEKENDKMRNIFRFFLKNNEANIGK